MADNSRYARAQGVSETRVDSEIFLVGPRTQEVFYLDEAAAALWRLIEEPRSMAEILAVYTAAFPETDRATIEADMQSALDRLSGRGLVTVVP